MKELDNAAKELLDDILNRVGVANKQAKQRAHHELKNKNYDAKEVKGIVYMALPGFYSSHQKQELINHFINDAGELKNIYVAPHQKQEIVDDYMF